MKSLASNKVQLKQNTYYITDQEYLETLLEDEEVIGGVSQGMFVYVDTDEENYLAFIPGNTSFENLPKLWEVPSDEE